MLCLTIKSEKISLEVYIEKIWLESGFWDGKCVYLFASFSFHFILISTSMGNESLHLFATSNVLQIGIMMCINSLLLLLCLLLFGANAQHEWVTYSCFVNVIWQFWYIFRTHQLPLYSCLRLWDKIGIKWFVASCSVCDTFIARWCFVCLVTRVQLGWSYRVSFSRLPTHDLPFIPYFSSFFCCFIFFLWAFRFSRALSFFLVISSNSSKFFLWTLSFPSFSSFLGRFFLD